MINRADRERRLEITPILLSRRVRAGCLFTNPRRKKIYSGPCVI